MRSIAFSLLATMRRMAGARGGNVAMVFGLLLVPLMIAGGMAIDLQRTGQARTGIQEAADAALLRAAQLKSNTPNMSDAELTKIARKVFEASARNLAGVDVKDFAVKFDKVNSDFTLKMKSEIPTTLMGVAGVKSIPINTLSAVKLGDPPYLEVMMALDNTGSMNQKGKLGDLKSSAKELVESILSDSKSGAMVGLVPFAQYVNVGDAYKDASWMAPTGKGWKGCVGSRDYPANLEDADYISKPIPGPNGAACPDPILPLSKDKEAVLDAIDDMDGNGWTYIPSGLAWGWRALTPGAPFTEGLTFEELEKRNGVKALVVLTDGENTRAPDYPTHNSANQSLADDLMIKLCDSIKKDEIVIYSIAFDVSDATIRGLMEDCATTPGHYFDPSTDGELASAFASIATSLRSLSLSR